VVNALLLALVLAVGSGWLLWDNRRRVVTGQQIEVASAPSGEVLRIAQVSDLHAADHGRFQDEIVREVRVRQADMIALTGDLVDIRTTDLGPVLALAARLSDVAPTFFVLGNHEADSPLREELLDGLEEAGVRILRDEAASIELKGLEVTVAGLDDPRVAWADGHRPELLERYAGHGADLVLSGHAHGGQVRLPLIGPLFAPHQGWFPELTEGVHTRGDTSMVISRGLGNSVVGVRVNNPRELVIVDLVQEAG
jgi:predicted MPP superfamily phosphohydrolase